MSERTWLVLSGRLMHTIRKNSLVYVFVHITICNFMYAHGNPITNKSMYVHIYIYICIQSCKYTVDMDTHTYIYIRILTNVYDYMQINLWTLETYTTHLHQKISEHVTACCPELHDGSQKDSTNVYVNIPTVPQHECNVLLIGNAVDMLPNWIEWSQGTKYLTPDFTSPP